MTKRLREVPIERKFPVHPYSYIRLTECPDIGDIKNEGRKSSIGRITSREKAHLQNRDFEYKSYTRRSSRRRAVRRNLKKHNRNLELRTTD